jgi:integrase
MPASSFSRVYNARGHRIRGLWVRNGIFYAQFRLTSHKNAVKIRLKDAKTVAQATAALQALKMKRSAGGLEVSRTRAVPRFSDVADAYLAELRQLGTKKPKTIQCEASNITKLKAFLGAKPVTGITMKDAYSFARWRRSGQAKPGRTVDLSIRTLRHVLAKAVRDGHIGSVSVGPWKALATPPAKKRLVSRTEVEAICAAGNQAFSDYIKLLMLSGGREQETTALKWSVSVDFTQRLLGFGQGDLARFSKNSKSRWMPMGDELYGHLRSMQLRRDHRTDWLFPNRWDRSKRTTSFKKALAAAKAACKITDFGFHHLRHYFISHCLICRADRKTVAQWVGQNDLLEEYIHISDEHSQRQAAQLKFT